LTGYLVSGGVKPKADHTDRSGVFGVLAQVDCGPLEKKDFRYDVPQKPIEKYDGGPVSLNTLAAALAEEEDALEEVYEPYLIQIGFLDRTPRGRVATKLAYQHLGLDMPRKPTLF